MCEIFIFIDNILIIFQSNGKARDEKGGRRIEIFLELA
jgi:hypothetical protein